MADKASAAETQRRIQEIIEKQVIGTSSGDIVQYATENWGIQVRAANTLIAKATKELKSRFDNQRDDIAGLLVAQHYEVYRQALDAGQFSPAVGALKEVARLTGANAPEEHAHTGPQPKLYVGWSPDIWDADDPPTEEPEA